MSERERWIVYPLLLFALGAALRDKMIQRIDSKEIRCESLQIIDRQNPEQVLAELKFNSSHPSDPSQLAERNGVLQLRDSDGRQVCSLDQSLTVDSLTTNLLKVVDVYQNPLIVGRPELQPPLSTRPGNLAGTYEGVLYLNNQRVHLRLAPPAENTSPPQNATEAPQTEPAPEAEPSGGADPAPTASLH